MAENIGQAKITRAGQVTLSKRIREELGVDIGGYVMFQKVGALVVIQPVELRIKGT